MADLKKFEEMLERLINEDREGAQELFHDIVVEKSRGIYESLLEDEQEDEDVGEIETDSKISISYSFNEHGQRVAEKILVLE